MTPEFWAGFFLAFLLMAVFIGGGAVALAVVRAGRLELADREDA